MKKERKARKETPRPDPLEPIGDLMVIGSKNDPCFGKHQDPLNSICRKCGDAEMCAIVKGQRLHTKREAQGTFMDQEEPNLDIERMEKVITKTLIKTPEGLSLARVQQIIHKHFSEFEPVDRKVSDKMVKDFCKRSPKYRKFIKNETKYLAIK